MHVVINVYYFRFGNITVRTMAKDQLIPCAVECVTRFSTEHPRQLEAVYELKNGQSALKKLKSDRAYKYRLHIFQYIQLCSIFDFVILFPRTLRTEPLCPPSVLPSRV